MPIDLSQTILGSRPTLAEEQRRRSTWDRATTLHCIKCERPVYVDADEPGPIRCASCRQAKDVRTRPTHGEAA